MLVEIHNIYTFKVNGKVEKTNKKVLKKKQESVEKQDWLEQSFRYLKDRGPAQWGKTK